MKLTNIKEIAGDILDKICVLITYFIVSSSCSHYFLSLVYLTDINEEVARQNFHYSTIIGVCVVSLFTLKGLCSSLKIDLTDKDKDKE